MAYLWRYPTKSDTARFELDKNSNEDTVMGKWLFIIIAILSLGPVAGSSTAHAQMMGGMGGVLPNRQESFDLLEAGVDFYFNELLDSENMTAQQKANAHSAIQDLAIAESQKPDSLFTEDELAVVYKLRLLMEHDSRFTSIEHGGLPDDLKALWFQRYENLTNWPDRGL